MSADTFSAADRALRLLASLEANAVDDSVHIDPRIGELAELYAGCAQHILLMNEDGAYAKAFTAALEARRRRNDAALAVGVFEAVVDVDVDAPRARLEFAAVAKADGAPTARAFQVASYLQRMAADVDFAYVGVTRHEVEMMIRGWNMDAATRRAQVQLLADRFGLAYGEKDAGGGKTNCGATGEIGGVPVELWGLVPTAELGAAGHAGLPAPTPGLAERTADFLAVAVGMQVVVPDGRWSIWEGDPQEQVKVSVHRDGLTVQRAEVRRIAAALGLVCDEKPHSEAFGMKVFARGDVDGVTVEVYGLAKPDAPESVDDGGALNDAGRDVAEDAWQRAEAAAEEEHFAEADAQFADCAAGDDQAAAAEGWYSPSREYFPDAGSIPTAEELAEEEPTDRALTVSKIQAMFRAVDAAAEARSEADL